METVNLNDRPHTGHFMVAVADGLALVTVVMGGRMAMLNVTDCDILIGEVEKRPALYDFLLKDVVYKQTRCTHTHC